jgi:hypothetical protein
VEPIVCALVFGVAALLTSLTHSAAAHTPVHTAAFAPHGVTTATGAAILSHSAPTVRQLACCKIAAAHTQGILPALKGAAAVLAEVGAAGGITMDLSEVVEGVRHRDARRAARGAAEAGMGIHDLLDIACKPPEHGFLRNS